MKSRIVTPQSPASPALAKKRAAWLKERMQGIGASEAPAVMGVSPFTTPLQLFTRKLGLEKEQERTEPMEWGLRLERAIVEAYADKTGREVRVLPPYTLVRSKKRPFMFTTLDALVFDPKRGHGVLEVKTSGEDWDENDLPLDYLVQVQHQIETVDTVTKEQKGKLLGIKGDITWGALAVLVRGSRFKHVDIDRHDGTITRLVDAEADFMRRLKTYDEPAAGPLDVDALTALYPKDAGSTIALPGDCIEWFDETRKLDEEIKEKTARLDSLKNAFRQLLGENAQGILPDRRRVSWKWEKAHYEAKDAFDIEKRVLRFHKK